MPPRVLAEPVQRLFAVARSTLPYGHYFYPLYTLGAEQLYRVADSAALHRYRDLGGPKSKRGRDPAFATRIDWLRERGAIAAEYIARWDGFRELRNIASPLGRSEPEQRYSPPVVPRWVRVQSWAVIALMLGVPTWVSIRNHGVVYAVVVDLVIVASIGLIYVYVRSRRDRG